MYVCLFSVWRLDTLRSSLRKLGHNQQLPERAKRERKEESERKRKKGKEKEKENNMHALSVMLCTADYMYTCVLNITSGLAATDHREARLGSAASPLLWRCSRPKAGQRGRLPALPCLVSRWPRSAQANHDSPGYGLSAHRALSAAARCRLSCLLSA